MRGIYFTSFLALALGCSSGAGGNDDDTATGGSLGEGMQTGGSPGDVPPGTGGAASGGQAASGGAPGTGGASGGSTTGGAGTGGAGTGGGASSLTPCTAPSVSRLTVWETQIVGGVQTPPDGSSPLHERGAAAGSACGGSTPCVMEIAWTIEPPEPSSKWGTANVPLNNQGEFTNGANPAANAVDLSALTGVTLTYQSIGALFLQLRTGAVPHGGDHFRIDIPAAGSVQSVTLPFADFRRPGGTTPPDDSILSDVFSFTIATSGSSSITLEQLEVVGYEPPCD